MTQNKKELTTEQLKHAIAAMRARFAAITDLISAFDYKGKYCQVTQWYTETMGIWPMTNINAGDRYTGDEFWQDRPELCEKLEKIESALGKQRYHSIIDDSAFDAGLRYNRDCCEAILNHLVDELAEREKKARLEKDFDTLRDNIDKLVGGFVDAHLVDAKGCVDYKNEKERAMLDKLTNVQEILGLL